MEPEYATGRFNPDDSLQSSHQVSEAKQHARIGVIRESDIDAAPIANEHKDHIMIQINRLNRILDEPYAEIINFPGKPLDKLREQSRRKRAAQRQLARMTIVFRRLLWKQSQDSGLEEIELESRVADIIDASLYDDRRRGRALLSIASAIDPIIDDGERQEMQLLVQEMIAENVDDVIELHNVDLSDEDETVVPDICYVRHPGEDAQFRHWYAESKSDDERVYRARKKRVPESTKLEKSHSLPVKLKENPEQLLSHAVQPKEKKQHVDLRWPPKVKAKRPTLKSSVYWSYGPQRSK